MGLFSKTCDICGEKAGMISGKKLLDGDICGDCVKKLSPWFHGYNESTVSDIERQLEWRSKSEQKLEGFAPTKAWGIKKYPEAMQFIFDLEKKLFVVVPGPEETFKERKPDVFSFDEVTGVTLDIDEYWSEGQGEYGPRGTGNVLQENYGDVFWRYDFYLSIALDNEFVDEIGYKMNYRTTIMKVPQRITYRRGLEIGGTYEGAELTELAGIMDGIGKSENKALDMERKIDVVLLRNKDKSFLEKLSDGLNDDVYLKKLENVSAHIKRADRISKLLLG